MDPEIEYAIRRVAERHQIDPALMMAIAERESSFNVRGGSGSPYSSAFGLFQLLRGERAKYGGSSLDPEEQAEAWANYIKPVQQEMAPILGRMPTGPETYAGHYWGGTRAAHMVAGHYDPNMPLGAVFTPKEMAANPNFGRAGTVGNLTSSVLGDIDRRMNKFGGASPAATTGHYAAGDLYPGEKVEEEPNLYPGELVKEEGATNEAPQQAPLPAGPA